MVDSLSAGQVHAGPSPQTQGITTRALLQPAYQTYNQDPQSGKSGSKAQPFKDKNSGKLESLNGYILKREFILSPEKSQALIKTGESSPIYHDDLFAQAAKNKQKISRRPTSFGDKLLNSNANHIIIENQGMCEQINSP